MEEENQNIEKDITELTEIGKEIDTLEKRLEAVPGVEELDVKKYNRKQRRQMERQMVRNEKEQQRKLEQKGSTYVTRKEFAGLFQSAGMSTFAVLLALLLIAAVVAISVAMRQLFRK